MTDRIDYAGLRATAVELLRGAGAQGVIGYFTLGAYDNATLTQARTPATLDVDIVELELSGRTDAGATNGTVKRRVKKFLVSPLDTNGAELPQDPQPTGWTLTGSDGVVWSIQNVKVLRPGGVALLYTLECVSG